METIEENQIDEIATQVAAEILGAAVVSSAVTTMTVDSRGRDDHHQLDPRIGRRLRQPPCSL